MDTLPDDDSGATTETIVWTNGGASWRVLRCADGSRVAMRYEGEAAQMSLVVPLPARPACSSRSYAGLEPKPLGMDPE